MWRGRMWGRWLLNDEFWIRNQKLEGETDFGKFRCIISIFILTGKEKLCCDEE